MKKVFISYSHDSDEHCNRVLETQGRQEEAEKIFIKSTTINQQIVVMNSTNALWRQGLDNVLSWLEYLGHKLANK